MKVQIYCLIDPNTLKVRYIGRTKKEKLSQRLAEHISNSIYFLKYYPLLKKTHKENWICNLHNNNQKPLIRKLAIIEGWEESHIFEKSLINKYHYRLLNHNDKGIGGINKIISDLQKEQISKTLKDKYQKGIIKIQGERTFYVYDKEGMFLYEKTNLKRYAKEIAVPFRRISKTLNLTSIYYYDYIFSYIKTDKLVHNFKHISTKKKIKVLPKGCRFTYKVFFKDTDTMKIVHSLEDLIKILGLENKRKVFNKIMITVNFKKLNVIIEKCVLK